MELFISYLLGSINFSWIIGKIFGIDISKKNDENLGATNLYYAALNKYKNRKLSFFLFLFSGFLDLLKAYIPTILFGPLAGAFAVIGHCFSIFSIIITKKIPSGVGAAPSIGWLLGLDIVEILSILSIAIPLLIIGILLFHDIFEFERLHMYSIFLFLSSALLYIVMFDPNEIIKFSIIIISISSSFARVLRLKRLFKRMIEKSPGGGI